MAHHYVIDFRDDESAAKLYWGHYNLPESKRPVLTLLRFKTMKEARRKMHIIELLCAATRGNINAAENVMLYPATVRYKRTDY